MKLASLFFLIACISLITGCAVLDPNEQYDHGKWNEKHNYCVSAFNWYQKAANQGHAEAQYELGKIYQNGAFEIVFGQNKTIEADQQKAFEWYLKAANQGHVKAKYKVFYCYLNGIGTNKDYDKAVLLSRELVDQSDSENIFIFAELHREAGDYKNAMNFYQKGADGGHARSIFWMGKYYEDGVCVDKDLTKAIDLYKKASLLGDEEAKSLLAELSPKKVERNTPAYEVPWTNVEAQEEIQTFKKFLAEKNPDPVPRIRYLNACEIEFAMFFSYDTKDGGWEKINSKTEMEKFTQHDRYDQREKTLKKRTMQDGEIQYAIFYSGIAKMPDYSSVRSAMRERNIWERKCSCNSRFNATTSKCKKCQLID